MSTSSNSPGRSSDSGQQQQHHRAQGRSSTPPSHGSAPATPSRGDNGTGGDRHTHRLMEPVPLRVPYGVTHNYAAAARASSRVFNRSSSVHVIGGESDGFGGYADRNTINPRASAADQHHPTSTPAYTRQNSSRTFESLSSKARLESILDEFRSGTSRRPRTPSLEHDRSAPITGNTTYERHLLQQKHGFPLWIPHPNVHLPKSYVEKGVSVGDVGIITQYGAFDYLFNICLPAEHPNNSGQLPEGFVPLLIQQKDIVEYQEHTSGAYISSRSVTKLSGLSFESSGADDAVLAIPEGAFHEDIRNLTKFREYAALHAHSWYKFVNSPVSGREIDNGELHLVTGCDKTAAWGIATFSGDRSTKDVPTSLAFTAQESAGKIIYSWEHTGHAEVKTYPSFAALSSDSTRNQCTFFRSHTVSLSDDEWDKLMASIGTPSPEIPDVRTIDTVANRSKNTLKRLFSFGPKASSSKSSKVSIHPSSDASSRPFHPGSILNKVLLQKCPQARLAVTHDDDWALLSYEFLQPGNVTQLWSELTRRMNIIVDPSGTAYLNPKDTTEPEDIHLPLSAELSSQASGIFPFADAALPGGLDESDFTIESLIEMLTSPTAPTPSHIHLLAKLLSKQTPPRFSTLQPVLARLCSPVAELALQALGYEVMSSYWNNPKVRNASWPTTSDALSCLTFFLDFPPQWYLDLWEVRFHALFAITKDGTDLRGIETVVVEVVKSCISNAFRLLTDPPKGVPTPPATECERCIVAVGQFLADLLAYKGNVARIREELMMGIFEFYATLIDEHIQLSSPHQGQTPLSPTEAPAAVPRASTEKSGRKSHKKRAPSLTSFMFLSSPAPAEQPHPLPLKSKDPADIAISLFLGHASAHLLHLSPEQLWHVLPVLFRVLAFCASPLPRLAFPIHDAGGHYKTLEDRIVEFLNTLILSPSSTIVMRVLKHYLSPVEAGIDELSYDNSNVLRKFTLMVMTSLGAQRTLRNYLRRALTARLEKAYRPKEVATQEGLASRSSFDQELLDVGWIRHDQTLGTSSQSAEARAISSSVDAWVTWPPDVPDFVTAPQSELWDRIMEGKENILEESAGILKDIYQEFDFREGGGLHVDDSELVPINEALRSLSAYIFTLQSPDGSPFIINAFNPGESPTPLLRSITTLLSRDFPMTQKPLLADILIQGYEHVTDDNTARIPTLMTDNYALIPLTQTWLENWIKILTPELLSPNRPQTRAAIIDTLYEAYDSIKESPGYRKALAQLVMEASDSLIAQEASDPVFAILEEEAIYIIGESNESGGDGPTSPVDENAKHHPVRLLISLLFTHPDAPTTHPAIRSLIHIFSEISFTSLSFNLTNQELAVSIFHTFLRALSELSQPKPRMMILQFLMRLRADRDHRVFFALNAHDTNDSIAYLASLINRLPDSLMKMHKDEILGEHVARNRQTRARAPPSRSTTRLGEGPPNVTRGRSHTILEIPKERTTLWQLPEELPFRATEPDTIKNGLRSFDTSKGGVLLPVSRYITTLVKLVEKDPSWELVSYILCHLPVQLANKHLFCGPNARASLTELLYILSRGVINKTLASQTGEDCPDDLKLRDLQGLAHHTLSTLTSYKIDFDLQQRQLLVEAFYSGLDGPFSTIKCCLHALSLSAFEMSTSLSKCLPQILEKLAQIMSNPNMAVHILAFLVMVGSLPSLHASFTEEDFKMVFGVALQYLQHYNQLRESPTRSWALSQHVRQQSYVTVYTWFSVLKISDRPLHIPYITRQLLLANEGREEVDGLTQVCFDWLARNTYGVANAEVRVMQDIVLQPNIAKPTNAPLSRTWLYGTSFLSIRNLDRPGWIEVLSRRPSGSARLVCRDDDFHQVGAVCGPPEFQASLPKHRGDEQQHTGDSRTFVETAKSPTSSSPSPELSFASRLFFHMSPLSESTAAVNPTLKEITDVPNLSKSIIVLDRLPVIDTHKVGIMYVGPGQTDEVDILTNTHGSQAYSRFLDGIGRLVRLRTEKDVYTGTLDPDEDGEYAYAWWDDIRQVLFHTATLMPNREHDPMRNYKKRHIGNDFVRIIWNDSGLPYAFGTLKTAFQFVNIVIEPHSVGTISAFSNDAHENEYFRVIVQTAEGMTECTPVGQFKIVSAVNLPHVIRHLSVFSDCFTSIFSLTEHDTSRLEIKTNWNARLDAMERFKRNISAHQQSQSNESQSSSQSSA